MRELARLVSFIFDFCTRNVFQTLYHLILVMNRFLSRLTGGSGKPVRAVVYDYSAPDNMRFVSDFASYEPTSSEIQVKVIAAGLNPIDFKIPELPPASFVRKGQPVGVDFCGEVVKTQPGLEFSVGDRVFGMAESGSLAEIITAPASNAFLLPTSVDPVSAAAYPSAALTAFQALKYAGVDMTRVSANTTQPSAFCVLIIGASGGVGHFAVQLAKLAGLQVTAVCSSKNADFVSSVGAQTVLSYDKPGFAIPSRKFDAVLDLVSHPGGPDYEEAALEAVLPKGHIVATTTVHNSRWIGAVLNNFIGLPVFKKGYKLMMVKPDRKDFGILVELIRNGQIKAQVAKVAEFSDKGAKQAFDLLRSSRTAGKLVVKM